MINKKMYHRQVSAPKITLTPLIDTALVLLVIFMVATPMMRHAIKVDLPKGETHEADLSQQNIELFIDNKNQLYVDGVSVPHDALIAVIQKKVADREDQMVIVNADTSSSFGFVMELVDRLKLVGGIRHVAFSLQKPHKQPSA